VGEGAAGATARVDRLAAEGKDLYAARACVGCHTIQGVSAGVVGPDLTHFGQS
jgi:mono/diheme cytochrome c family protein